MKFATLFCASTLGVAAMFLSGCSAPADNEPATKAPVEEEPDPIATVNTRCPIMGGKVTADGGSAEWNGKVVGFCCPECIDKWAALSDEEKQAKLDKAAAGEGEGAHDHAAHGGHGGDSDDTDDSDDAGKGEHEGQDGKQAPEASKDAK